MISPIGNINFFINLNFFKKSEQIPIVFLHGFTGSGSVWCDIQKKIHYPSLTIDLPGHGKTVIRNLKQPYNFKHWIDDLMQILDHHNLNKIHLCGYSMGGRLALAFAIHHHEKIKSLILESTSPGITDKKERQNRIEGDEVLQQKIIHQFDQFLIDWNKLPFFNQQTKRNPDGWRELNLIRKHSYPNGLAYAVKHLGTGNQPSYWTELQNIKFPVLLLTGAEDEKYCKIAEKMQSKITDAKWEKIADSGHTTHLEQLELFVKTISNWSSEVDNLKI